MQPGHGAAGKAKAQWKRFQQDDKAAFGRWMASTFGALLSRLREIKAAVHAREALIQEVEMRLRESPEPAQQSASRLSAPCATGSLAAPGFAWWQALWNKLLSPLPNCNAVAQTP